MRRADVNPVPRTLAGDDTVIGLTLAFPPQIDYSPRFAFAPAGG